MAGDTIKDAPRPRSGPTTSALAGSRRLRLPSRRDIGGFAKLHAPLLFVLLAAAALRVAVAIAYYPALLWSDTWEYVIAGYGRPTVNFLGVGFLVDKPSGYPALLRILEIPGRSLTFLTAVQHLAGLVGGVLVYALLRGRGIASLLAAAAAGVVLLDSYAVALEQHVLSEAFFTLMLVLWAFAAVRWGRTTGGVVLASLALAAAVTIRAVALLAIPVWLIYCLWSYPDMRRRIAALVAIAVPLLCYAAYYQHLGGGFGLTQMNGYLLYARVGQIADCRGLDIRRDQRPLCPRGAIDEFEIQGNFAGDRQIFYLYAARRIAGDPFAPNHPDVSASDRRLRDFAFEVIKARPLKFARLVAGITLDFVRPGVMSPIADFDRPILFPADPRPIDPAHQPFRRRFLPDYVAGIREPSEALRTYQRWIHTPRWLVGGLILVAFVEMVALVSSRARSRLSQQREVFLLVGAGLALVVGAALNHFEPRYLIPAVPLIVSGGTLAISDLFGAVTRRRTGGEDSPVVA
jgi:hypothetical protein